MRRACSLPVCVRERVCVCGGGGGGVSDWSKMDLFWWRIQ